jgi:hypothetical protein
MTGALTNTAFRIREKWQDEVPVATRKRRGNTLPPQFSDERTERHWSPKLPTQTMVRRFEGAGRALSLLRSLQRERIAAFAIRAFQSA